MNLFIEGFKHDSKYFLKENIKVVFSGRRKNLRQDVLDAMDKLTELTKDNTLGTLNVCLNYGGRAEIVDAINKAIEKGHTKMTEELLNTYMYNDLPDIDFMIIHKPAMIKFDKHVASNIIPASANQNADADFIKYRKYGMVDAYANKRAGIYMHTK